MGKVKRVLTRRNLAAVVVGIFLAGAPLVIFNFWIGDIAERQARDDLNGSAKRAIGLADARIGQVVEALDRLAAKGVGSCEPYHVQMMRRAAFATMPIKEVAVVSRSGETLCTHLGLPLGQRKLISSEWLVGTDGYTLDVFEIDNGERVIRLRRPVGAENSIAALVPATQLLPQVSNEGKPFDRFAQVKTASGTVIGYVGTRPPENVKLQTAVDTSARHGLVAEIVATHNAMEADRSDVKWLGVYLSAVMLLIFAAFLSLLPRRRESDPVSDLKRALAAGELVPYYQPIVDIRSGQLRGAEVLVRWRKPDGSLVLPGAFIPLAESSGLIREMTRDLMRRVCAEAGPALARRPGLKVSFNFAGKLFTDESIVKDVRNIFANSPLKLSQVVLEVTERDPIENFTETRQIIAALQGLGVRIAIDDVGTGHSGLSYMLKLGVDIIKIDKMFVDAIGTDRNSTTIIETLVDLAHNMRMDIVAEGVENFEQVMHLRELGIRSAQGYVFAPPLPGSAFLQLVEAIDPLEAADPAAPKEAA
jgi:sensor c-di-GMP phosphodiesterase-like protein